MFSLTRFFILVVVRPHFFLHQKKKDTGMKSYGFHFFPEVTEYGMKMYEFQFLILLIILLPKASFLALS